jgi:hypothetical protein
MEKETKNESSSDAETSDFEMGNKLSDLKLIVEDKYLYVHKAILGIPTTSKLKPLKIYHFLKK